MMLEICGIVVGLYAVLYLVFSSIIAFGEKRLIQRELPPVLPRVSVVVCARNEAKNIRRCLESLLKLDYPRDKLEIIVVDDESEDNTLSIMQEYAGLDGSIRVLSAAGESHILHAKQRPLNMGIHESSGEIIVLTDADIAVRPGWIKAHIMAYHPHIGIVGGTTKVDVSSGSLYDRLQNCDLISKHAVAMGCAGLGFPLTLMGNNFSFRRDAYDQVGGLMAMNHSIVEDMALMNAIVRQTEYTQGWINDKNGVVVSAPEENFTTFINQRLRWVHELTDLSLIGKTMISIETLMLVCFFVSLIMIPWTWKPFTAVSLSWIIGYLIFLFPSPGREKGDMPFIPPTIVFQMIYGIVFGWRKYFRREKIVWKGRVFE
jgi:cellulose synthase/poly-beta-1,6-N-acetylglucosamine synthase-like glycosyltransferase